MRSNAPAEQFYKNVCQMQKCVESVEKVERKTNPEHRANLKSTGTTLAFGTFVKKLFQNFFYLWRSVDGTECKEKVVM
jgi:hypothetical protein